MTAGNRNADCSSHDRTSKIFSEEYTKGAVYCELLQRYSDSGSSEDDVEAHQSYDGSADEDKRDIEFEFSNEKEDFASAFVPPGFWLTCVRDGEVEGCRMIFKH